MNRPIFTHDGRLLGYADLLDAEAGLVVEYDGADHRAARRHSKDVDREDLFRRHALEVTHLTSADVLDRGKTVGRLHAARARARWLPEAARSWTLDYPEEWQFELPLDLELDRRGEQV